MTLFAEPEGRRVPVLLPLPLAGAYDYAVPDGWPMPVPGSYVLAPLGPQRVAGVVWTLESGAAAPPLAAARLKPLLELYSLPPLPASMRRFVDWVARYSLTPPGEVLRMVMPVPAALTPPPPQTLLRLAPGLEIAPLSRARRRVAEALADGAGLRPTALATRAGCGAEVIRRMVEAGLLVKDAADDSEPPQPDGAHPGPTLSGDQQAAATALRATAGQGYCVTVLDGVTGSGKTEVYFEAIAAMLQRERSTLVLLPEIALSAQWIGRFTQRFGAPPEIWHSDLGAAARRRAWRRAALGRGRVVVGARSALFLPLPDLGLIVVDEEHDAAFKQEEGVIYHARDMAVVRARIEGIPLILASATPSLESLANVETGRYQRLALPDRHGGALLPVVEIVDLRADKPARDAALGPRLRARIAETLARGEQSLLFLNRRGYAPLTLCRACGHRLDCPRCSAWLVDHRQIGRLKCHHCGYQTRPPSRCPACGTEDAWTACGPGVERLEEEVRAQFPAARLALASSDGLSGPAAAADLVARMQAGEIDILIGTQLVAKGYHFPGLTLVGVVDADLGLGGGDPRAGERSFQMLQQVAGRAGRADRPGRVVLQTRNPDHPVIQALAAGGRDQFLAAERAERAAWGMPPFTRLAALILASKDPVALEAAGRSLAAAAPAIDGLTILGPAEAPMRLLRGWHRSRFLIRAAKDLPLQRLLSDWRARVKLPGKVRLDIDIDPYNFL